MDCVSIDFLCRQKNEEHQSCQRLLSIEAATYKIYIGGWGEKRSDPNREIVSFRACVRRAVSGCEVESRCRNGAMRLSLFPFVARAFPFSLEDPPPPTSYPALAGLMDIDGVHQTCRRCVSYIKREKRREHRRCHRDTKNISHMSECVVL